MLQDYLEWQVIQLKMKKILDGMELKWCNKSVKPEL